MSRLVLPAHTGQRVAHPVETPASAAPPTERSTSATHPTVPLARVYGALALGVVCIALSAIFTRQAQVPGTVSALYRVGTAAVVLAPLFLRNVRRGVVVRGRRVWLLAAAAGLFFMLDVAVWNTSLFLTNVANATLLANISPIVVGLGALLVFHERLRISYWLGLAIALCGMSVIIGHDLFSGSGLGAGDLLAMMAGFFYALYMLVIQRVRVSMDTLSSLWISTVVGTLLTARAQYCAGPFDVGIHAIAVCDALRAGIDLAGRGLPRHQLRAWPPARLHRLADAAWPANSDGAVGGAVAQRVA